MGFLVTSATADPNANRTRWGGILLSVGALLVLVSIGLYIGLVDAGAPADDAANAEQATHYAAKGSELEIAGWVGVYADLLVAAAAFFLVTRVLTTKSTLPGSASWLLVAVGNLIFIGLDAFNATALSTIAASYATTPALFDAAFALSNAGFGIGLLAIGLGLCGVFWGEARAENATMPAILCYVGFAGAVTTVIGAFGPILGVPALFYVSVGMFLSLLLLVYMGVRLGFPNLPIGKRTEDARTQRA